MTIVIFQTLTVGGNAKCSSFKKIQQALKTSNQKCGRVFESGTGSTF
jgi:hypothetical protein